MGDIAEKINSGKTPLGGEAVYSDEGVLFIRSQNVNNDKLDLSSSVYIPEAVNEGMKNSVVLPNDILLNITGASLGRSCVVPGGFTVGNVNQHVCIIRLGKEYNPRFIQPILSSVKGQNILTSLQTGSGREGLNFESIRRIKVYTPNQVEQDKIASFLAIIQDRIDTQNKIIEKLETLIKGIRECLLAGRLRFMDNGNSFPDWQAKKIEDVLKIASGRDYRHLSEGSIPVFGTGGLMTNVDSFLHDGETVCIGRKGTIDKPMYYKGKIWTVDTLFFTHSFTNVLPKFVFYTFQSINWKEHNEASGVPSLSKNTIEKISFKIPSEKEQRYVVAALDSVSQKIENEKEIISVYQRQQQYFLDKLFI